MGAEYYYDIHGVKIKVKIEKQSGYRNKLLRGILSSLEYFREATQDEDADITFTDEVFQVKESYEFGEGYYYGRTFLYSTFSGACYERRDERYIIHLHPHSKLVNFNLIIWLQLLKKGLTFVHAAGLERNGKAMLFPAWGGVGKTSLTITALSHGSKSNWKLLSDDMPILSKEGVVYCYPMPFMVYFYHIPLFREYFAKHFKEKMKLTLTEKIKPLSHFSLLRRLLRKLGIYQDCIPVPVKDVLPKEKISIKASLSRIYVLTRSASSKLRIESMHKEHVIRHFYNLWCYSVVEDPLCLADIVAASTCGVFDFHDALNEFKQILERALSGAECYKVVIPLTFDPCRVFEYIESHLNTSERV